MEFVGDDVLEFIGDQIVWSWWCSAQELYEEARRGIETLGRSTTTVCLLGVVIELVQASTVRY